MKKTFLYLLLGSLFLLVSCSEPKYEKEDSAYILFKTPTFRYADMGFVYKSRDAVKAEIYGSGQALMSLTMKKDKVCMSSFTCMSQKSFNSEILSANYPDDTLEKIFRAQPIFDSYKVKKSATGFTQKFSQNGKYSINYSVSNSDVLFHDTINNIVIKIKKQ